MEKAKQDNTKHRPKRHILRHSSTDEDESSSDEHISESLFSRKKPNAYKSFSELCRFTLCPPAMLIAPGRGGLISLDQLDSTQKEGNFYQFEAVQAEAKPEEVVLMSCQQEVNGFSLRQKRWSRSSSPDQGSTAYQFDASTFNFAWS